MSLLIKISEDNNIIEFTQEQILQIASMSKENESTYDKFLEWNKRRINSKIYLISKSFNILYSEMTDLVIMIKPDKR